MVHQLVPIDAQTGDGREPLVQTHQHREVRVRKQDRLHVWQRWQGNCRAKEVLVVPFAISKVSEGNGRGNQQFVIRGRDPTSIR